MSTTNKRTAKPGTKVDVKMGVNENGQIVTRVIWPDLTMEDIVVPQEQSLTLALGVLAKRGVRNIAHDANDGSYVVDFATDNSMPRGQA